MPRNFGIIPQSTRIESAARIACAYTGPHESAADWQPSAFLFACVCAGAFLAGWIIASVGPQL